MVLCVLALRARAPKILSKDVSRIYQGFADDVKTQKPQKYSVFGHFWINHPIIFGIIFGSISASFLDPKHMVFKNVEERPDADILGVYIEEVAGSCLSCITHLQKNLKTQLLMFM